MAAAAILKNQKSPYLGCGLTDFDQSLKFLKIQDGGGRHLDK